MWDINGTVLGLTQNHWTKAPIQEPMYSRTLKIASYLLFRSWPWLYSKWYLKFRIDPHLIDSFTDAGTPSSLSRTNGEVMTTVQGVIEHVFEHNTQYHLVHAPFTRFVIFWHIGNAPSRISLSQICCNTTTFCIATIFVKYCYATGSGWPNLRSSSCSPLGEKSLWNGTFG